MRTRGDVRYDQYVSYACAGEAQLCLRHRPWLAGVYTWTTHLTAHALTQPNQHPQLFHTDLGCRCEGVPGRNHGWALGVVLEARLAHIVLALAQGIDRRRAHSERSVEHVLVDCGGRTALSGRHRNVVAPTSSPEVARSSRCPAFRCCSRTGGEVGGVGTRPGAQSGTAAAQVGVWPTPARTTRSAAWISGAKNRSKLDMRQASRPDVPRHSAAGRWEWTTEAAGEAFEL